AVREYAHELLVASGESEAAARAHLGHFAGLAGEAEAELAGPNQSVWLSRLDRELNNIRVALRWARRSGESETAVRLLTRLRRFWDTRGHFRECRAFL